MVGIKNMKLPTCCRECDLVYSDDLTDLCCSCTGTDTEDYLHEVNSDCPLIDIVTCKECKQWKDSDRVFRRGIGVESKCHINTKEVFEGNFYCGYGERRK